MGELAVSLLVGFIGAALVGVCYTVVLYNRDDREHEREMMKAGLCRVVDRSSGYREEVYRPCAPR